MAATDSLNLHDNHTKLYMFVGMTAAWTLLYTAIHFLYRPSVKLSPKVLLDTKNRFVSIIHGVASFIMASYCFVFNEFKYILCYPQPAQYRVLKFHPALLPLLLRL